MHTPLKYSCSIKNSDHERPEYLIDIFGCSFAEYLELSGDILLHVFEYLDACSLATASAVCRYLMDSSILVSSLITVHYIGDVNAIGTSI